MRVTGQRWEFKLGNNHLIVENAWHWMGYSQERVRLNGETIKKREGWGWWVIGNTILVEFDLLDVSHAVVVGIEYTETNYTIHARVLTSDTIHKPDDWSLASWDTRTYLWPPDPDPYAA